MPPRLLALTAGGWVLVLSLFAMGPLGRGPARHPPRPPATSQLARTLNGAGAPGGPWHWSVTHAQASQGALVVEADLIDLAESMSAARAIVEPVRARYTEVLVYFRQAGTMGPQAARRVQWTPRGGYAELVLR